MTFVMCALQISRITEYDDKCKKKYYDKIILFF